MESQKNSMGFQHQTTKAAQLAHCENTPASESLCTIIEKQLPLQLGSHSWSISRLLEYPPPHPKKKKLMPVHVLNFDGAIYANGYV